MNFAKLDYRVVQALYNDKTGTVVSTIFPNAFAISQTNHTVQLLAPSYVAQNENGIPIEAKPFDDIRYPQISYVKDIEGHDISFDSENYSFVAPSSGIYSVQYDFYSNFVSTQKHSYYTYTFAAIENQYPTKLWTVTDVICRACETVETLKGNAKPRFRLQGVSYYRNQGTLVPTYEQGSQAEKYDKILAPEFSFTKMTLREMLKQVGGFIHAEPRISREVINGINGDDNYYEIVFDEYGDYNYSKIKELKAPVTEMLGADVNEYCTNIDSSAENLINQLNYAQGVITEPFNSGGIALRTENIAYRLEEDDQSVIPTTLPIYAVKSLICKGFKTGGTYTEFNYDLTSFVFELTKYKNLSSYKGTYPFAKAYGLFYTQGERNIKGLFFKPKDASGGVFTQYAIINILRSLTGNNNLTIDDYKTISFEITYLPIYSTRVKTNKAVIIKGLPSTLAYNQNANGIETRYYGENLKGVVARLGNIEKTVTYNLAFLSDIPKVGLLYDENYYISAVSVMIYPSYIQCSLGLSKDFNRLSEYIGINSIKRMWEVSERQTQERQTTVVEYLKISHTVPENYRTGNIAWNLNDIAKVLFVGTTSGTALTPISVAEISRYTKGKTLLTTPTYITLPVISSAMGNSMSFSFMFADNYSAGQKLTLSDNGEVQGWFGDYVPIGDYYGRFYWLGADYKANTSRVPFRSAEQTAIDLPSEPNAQGLNVISFKNNTLLHYRKDNRETPFIIYQLTAVSDTEDIVIGSALMFNCGLVTTDVKNIELRAFTHKISVIDGKPEDGIVIENGFTVNDTSIVLNNVEFPSNTVAWAICTEKTTITKTVSNEDNEPEEQTIEQGGEILIGENNAPESGRTLYFSLVENIYDRT